MAGTDNARNAPQAKPPSKSFFGLFVIMFLRRQESIPRDFAIQVKQSECHTESYCFHSKTPDACRGECKVILTEGVEGAHADVKLILMKYNGKPV